MSKLNENEYDFNENEVENIDDVGDDDWQLSCLNVDLALKKSELGDALANKYLFKKDSSGYFSNVAKARKEICEVHTKIIEILKRKLKV
ncbi:MAG: hypothetical protein PHW29_04380 [Flavobacterium sp.]|nr:hypothetical protein [Flavobacterium sp.]